MPNSPGTRFRKAIKEERPLQVVGTINAYSARMAEAVGFKALYLSGGGVAANSLGVPDLGISTMEDVLIDVRRITDAVSLPLLVDIDTGWGSAFNIARTIRSMIKAGAGAVHLEDQVNAKRCGHRPGKQLVPAEEMLDRLKAAVDARTDTGFVIMARTDALAVEGLDSAIDRAVRYVEAGADMIFAEAVTELDDYAKFKKAVSVPVLANITEFGKTPLWTRNELASAGVDIVLYCCAAYRAMNAAALETFRVIRREGTQRSRLPMMQTRDELYEFLNYHAYERKLDSLFCSEPENELLK
ncbi:MAG: methylisocitrate lyase [Bryobacterales bacterium]|nr:methylisocitrate lyase [Bryobacterales bacterium]